jgi:3-oxoacyl-[acyl-carrier-protein] synthase II
LGLVTSLGDSPDRVWAALAEGKGAIRPLQAFRIAGLPTDAGSEIADFDLKNYSLPRIRNALRKSRKYMARDIQLAVAAAQLAVQDAGLADGGVDPTRIGIDLGAGLISSELDEIAPAIENASSNGTPFDYQKWGRESIGMIEPIWLLKPYINSDGLPGTVKYDHRSGCILEPRDRRGRAHHRPRPR